MKGKKNPIIMGLVGAMLLSTGAFAATPSDFSDFPTDWSAPAMTRAVENGLLNGSDGKILPKGLLTRAQMATMVNRAFASSAKASLTNFTDMVPGAWHYDEMAKAVQMGVFQGADGKLSPNDPITREQAFAVLARAFGLADGKTSSLDQFSDGAQVSSWAKGAVAALVEQGYVKGADGALNPQSYITRAEFAQVMDALVAAYADKDLKDQTVEGNLILRTNSTLENVTVNGDLILSDGVSTASLKNVTVTGRIVVRGGSDKIALTKTTAKNGIQLANPNGKPNVTVDGKTYDPNGSNNGGSTSGGSTSGGSSSGGSSSSSGGNSSSKDTIVKANQTQVITTDAGTWLPLVFEDGYNKGNTTVTVDGQNVTDYVTNVTTEGTIAKLPLVAEPGTVTLTSNGKTQTIVVNQTAPATSAVYTEKTGYLPDYYLAHGPVALWDYYLTNYDDSGNARVHADRTTFDVSAPKAEHPSYSPVTVLDKNGKGTVEIMFNYTTDEDKAWFDGIAAYNADDTTGAVQLASYDQYKQTWNKHLSYTKDYKDHSGNTVGTLNIPFNQTNFTSNGRYYVRVASKDTNGKTTYATVPIHVVNNKVPTISIKETPKSGVNLHFEVTDLVYGITEPIEKVTLTKPDGKVETLKKIDDYYLFSQSLFVLYNDVTATNGKNHLDQNGEYKLHVEATGFQDFEATFKVNDSKNNTTTAMQNYGIDVLSGATTSIGGSDSSSGGGYAVSADLLFQSDLLANALILGDLGYANVDNPLIPAADAVLTWVQNTTFDAVFDTGDTMYFSKAKYIAASNQETWVPFSEYRNRDTVTADVYQPHATKEVLEDGLLGDILDASESGKLDYVKATVSDNQENSNVVLTFDKTNKHVGDYLEKIQSQGLVYLNGDWRELNASYYTIDKEKNTITFQARCFKVGSNTIQLKAAGYKVQDVTFDYEKVNENVTGLTVTQEDGVVKIAIDGSTNGDFLKNLKSITLTKGDEVDQVYHYGYEGGNAVYYVVAEDNTSVDLYNVTEPGEYTVQIEANYYTDPLTATFTVEGEVTTLDVPNMIVKQSETDGVYRVEFHENTSKENPATANEINAWKSAVTKVTVNSQEYTGYEYSSIKASSTDYTWTYGGGNEKVLLLGGNAFVTGENKIVISAKGYNDFTYTIIKTEQPSVEKKVPPVVNTTEEKSSSSSIAYYRTTFTGTTSDISSYLKSVSEVTVGGTAIGKYQFSSFYSGAEKVYTVSPNNNDYSGNVANLDITKDCFTGSGEIQVVVKADGYEDLTFTVTKETEPDQGEVKVPETAPTVIVDGSGYISNFQLQFEDAAAWLATVNTVEVNGSTYRKGYSYSVSSSEFWVNGSCMYIGKNMFSNETVYTVKITDKDGQSLTVKVDISAKTAEIVVDSGNNSGGETETKEAPQVSTIEKKPSSFYYASYYRVSFSGENKSIVEYLKADSTVKIGNESLRKASRQFESSDSKMFRIGNDINIVNTDYIFLDFTTDCFPTGNTKVTVMMKGYTELTFIVNVDEEGNYSIVSE